MSLKAKALAQLADSYQITPEALQESIIGSGIKIQFSRPLTWDLCYEYFYSKREKLINESPDEEALKNGALELYTYLGSYGMLRSSVLKHVNRLVLIHLLNKLFIEVNNLHINPYAHPTNIAAEDLSQLVATVYIAFRETLSLQTIIADIGKEPTDTMISKILMGTLGVLPAFDQNFCAAANAYNSAFKSLTKKNNVKANKIKVKKLPYMLLKRYNKPNYDVTNESDLKKVAANLEPLLDFVADPDVANFLRDGVGQIFKNDKLISTEYPTMRLLDLYFWGIGAMISPKKENQESGLPRNGKLA